MDQQSLLISWMKDIWSAMKCVIEIRENEHSEFEKFPLQELKMCHLKIACGYVPTCVEYADDGDIPISVF